MPSQVTVRRCRVVEEGNTRACSAGVLFGRSVRLDERGSVRRRTANVSASRKKARPSSVSRSATTYTDNGTCSKAVVRRRQQPDKVR